MRIYDFGFRIGAVSRGTTVPAWASKRPEAVMRTSGALTLALLTLLLPGCEEAASPNAHLWSGDPPDLPAGAPIVNCVTPHHAIPASLRYSALSNSPFKEAEAVVVARCAEVRQYTKIRRGEWDFWWYVVAFDVMRVERGVWPHPRVVFCCYDEWPTPESGIKVKKAPFPFCKGRVLALALEPRGVPPQVVAVEWRSHLPPHGKPRPLSFDLQSKEGKRLYERLDEAVRAFAEQNGWPEVTLASFFEETDDAYVLEVILQTDGESERRAVAVDEVTFAVREVP